MQAHRDRARIWRVTSEIRPDIRCNVVGRYVIFYRAVPDGIEVARVIPGDRDIKSL